MRKNKDLYDFVVVGAGIAGLSTAYNLLKNKYSVLVLEKSNIKDNASFHSNAIMSHDPDAKWDKVTKKFGVEGVKDIWELSELSINHLNKFAHETKPNFNTERLVSRIYSNSISKTKKLYEQFKIYKKAGVKAKFINDGKILHSAFDSYIEIEREGQTNNQAILKNLQKEVRRLGGTIMKKTPVVDISYTKTSATVTTKGRKIFHTHQVVLSTGTLVLLPKITPKTTIKRSFIVQFKKHKMDPFYTKAVSWDNEEPYHYIRSFRGNTLWIGGGDVYEKDFKPKFDYYKGIEKYARENLKLPKSYKREFAWNGKFYSTENGLPFIYKIPRSPIWVNYGFGGTGILTTFISGYLISSWIKGKEKKYQRLFMPKK